MLLESRRRAADLLLQSYVDRRPIPPLSESFGDVSIDDAYAIQLLQVAHWLSQGSVVKGHKIGLTARAMQQQLGVDSPDFGHLLDDMFFSSASRIGIDRFIQPRIEPEIAFLLGAPLKGPGVEFDDAEDAIDAVMPALEIIDSRIQNWRITLVDTVADNASSAAVVLGDPVPLDAASLPNVRGVLLCDDIEIVSGFGRDVMESPINALAWLANRLGELGQSLGANEIIMPGSLCASAPIRSGMKVEARFEGLGSVSAHFEQELQEER